MAEDRSAGAPAPTPLPGAARGRWRRSLRWFAAEFLVVVTGVLVALLVNAWWTGREASARERQNLTRLYHESEAIVGYLADHVEWNDTLLRHRERVVAAIQPEGAIEVPAEEFARGLFFAFTYPATSPPRTVYDEITQSGQFGSLSSDSVRSAISRYYGELALLDRQLAFFRQTAQPGIELTMTYPYAYDPEAPERMRLLVEPADLRGDARARSLLIVGLRNQTAFQELRRDVHQDAVRMCVVLADALDRACDGAAPSAP